VHRILCTLGESSGAERHRQDRHVAVGADRDRSQALHQSLENPCSV